MSKPFQPTPHPVLGLPTPAQAMAMGAAQWEAALMRREAIIRAEQTDPFNHLWEPPIWKVCDALLGFPWVDPVWADRMRRRLKFSKRISTLLILGGNRGGKTQYAASRAMRVLRGKAHARAWALHSQDAMSIAYHQPLFWAYMDPALKAKDIRSRTTYVTYKQKTGFSDSNFVLPNGADLTFKNYEMDRKSIEGGNLDFIWNDELVPPDWVETEEFRVVERNGVLLVTFTPVNGYSETVRMFQDGAEVVADSVNYLCPKDGGPPDPARALGLTPEQYEEVKAAALENRAAHCPQSVPESCEQWLTDGEGDLTGANRGNRETPASDPSLLSPLPPVESDREFERAPRVMKCVDPEEKRAIVFFHSRDNPYGNPKNIWSVLAAKPMDFIRERWFGMASKMQAMRFPKFNTKIHVVRPDQIPAAGTNYHFVDPTGGRNFFMSWFRVTPEAAYLVREWPGPYYIEGIGVPGPWALPDGKRADGRAGPAQTTFGWGLRDYKRQIAALEGWKDAETSEREGRKPTGEEIDQWDPNSGAKERVQERFMDSRFASEPKMEKDRPVTLLTDFEDLLLYFTPTPGDDISEGVQQINDALNYDTDRPVDFFNKPKLLISSECPNTIFALQTWTGKDGNKGACKDPIDLLRYFLLSECDYLGDQSGEPEDDEQAGREGHWQPDDYGHEHRPRKHY